MSARTKGPDKGRCAALGIRCHSGWAAYVVLSGDSSAPLLLERGRMELCDSRIKGSKQPFHEAEPMRLAAATVFLSRCQLRSEKVAQQVLLRLGDQYGPLVGCFLLEASGRQLPGLKEILASHALIHAAEGEFYRAVITNAAKRLGISTQRIRERDLEAAADRLPGTAPNRSRLLQQFGKEVGPPWRQDEKMATLCAWLALAARPTPVA